MQYFKNISHSLGFDFIALEQFLLYWKLSSLFMIMRSRSFYPFSLGCCQLLSFLNVCIYFMILKLFHSQFLVFLDGLFPVFVYKFPTILDPSCKASTFIPSNATSLIVHFTLTLLSIEVLLPRIIAAFPMKMRFLPRLRFSIF